MTNLFVYGTLMPGHPRHAIIEDYVHAEHAAQIPGVLVSLGSFPALIPGEGLVRGILLEVSARVFAMTDPIEGYRPQSDSSLFIRKRVVAKLDGGVEVETHVYEFARLDQLADCPRLVVGHENGVPVHAWITQPTAEQT